MDKRTNEWKNRPAWVRGLFFGSIRIQMDRQQHQKLEVIAMICGLILLAAGLLGLVGIWVPEEAVLRLLVAGSLLVLSAYLTSVCARIGDEYAVWPWLESSTDT